MYFTFKIFFLAMMEHIIPILWYQRYGEKSAVSQWYRIEGVFEKQRRHRILAGITQPSESTKRANGLSSWQNRAINRNESQTAADCRCDATRGDARWRDGRDAATPMLSVARSVHFPRGGSRRQRCPRSR